MKPPAAVCLVVVSIAALLFAGCGGGGSSAGSSSTEPARQPQGSGGPEQPAKKATAPRAPAGSKAISCTGGGRGASGLRAVATDCGTARETMRRWRQDPACRLGQGDSRASCSLGVYRCQAIDVDRGAAVSCARSDGADVSFIAARRR